MEEKEEMMERMETTGRGADRVTVAAAETGVGIDSISAAETGVGADSVSVAVAETGAGAVQENVLRRHIREDPKKALLAKHKAWMDGIQREFPMPHVPYKIGIYIRFFNQTRHDNYLDKHIQQFKDDIALCPKWTLVDFYIDYGQNPPGMTFSPEWCRLLDDCMAGRVNLIVTQKASNISRDSFDLAFVARALATRKNPVGIYCISDDIFTLASYYLEDMRDDGFLPEGWEVLPEDEWDRMPALPTREEGDGTNTQKGDEADDGGTE